MPPIRTKSKAEALVLRFRAVCRSQKITRAEGFKILNSHFLRDQPIKQATYDKLAYGPAGRNVSADTALALSSFIAHFTAK